MPLPEFIVIGAGKAGTSTIHTTLRKHPKIGMSVFKEPNYFTKNFHKGAGWYTKLFLDEVKVNGEVSPSYSMRDSFPETAERIAKTIPDAKLIYIVRDPVDRIISHLHHNLYRDRLRFKTVNEVALEDPQYINTSKYFYQISSYLNFFDKKNILFLQMEELKIEPCVFFNKIFDFIEIDILNFTKKISINNESSKRYLIKYFDVAHKILPEKAIRFYDLFFYMLNIKIAKPVLEEKTLKIIKSRLEKDVEEFKKITGEDFSYWKTYHNL